MKNHNKAKIIAEAIKILKDYLKNDDDKTKKKSKIVKKLFYNDEKNEIDLSKINLEKENVNFSGIKAENIDNHYQESKGFIDNFGQKANNIVNASQKAKDVIWNVEQESPLIHNRGQKDSWFY